MTTNNTRWLITNAEGDYWSNTLGWAGRDSADRFTAAETGIMLLPMGDGVEWRMDTLQFPPK